MKKLKLPRFEEEMPDEKPVLSMDEYLAFVQFNLANVSNPHALQHAKEGQHVDVPFKLAG